MGGDKFKKAQAGRPLEIPASTWNAMVDAARSNAESQHDQRGESDSLLHRATSSRSVTKVAGTLIDSRSWESTRLSSFQR